MTGSGAPGRSHITDASTATTTIARRSRKVTPPRLRGRYVRTPPSGRPRNGTNRKLLGIRRTRPPKRVNDESSSLVRVSDGTLRAGTGACESGTPSLDYTSYARAVAYMIMAAG